MKALKSNLAKRILRSGKKLPLRNELLEFEGKIYRAVPVPKAS